MIKINSNKNPKFKYKILFFLFMLLSIGGLCALGYAAASELFGVKKSNWISALFSWISAMSAVFLGLVAYWQNERFKIENDISAQKAKEVASKQNEELLSINNRLIQLEENKEKAYITFSQRVVHVYNDSERFKLQEKPYLAGFSDESYKGKESGVFLLYLVNLTDVPIRSIEIHNLDVCYKNWYTENSNNILNFEKGGFIPSPITTKNKEFLCAFVIPGAKDIAVHLPDKAEIVLRLTTSVESIYGRDTTQNFMLRLQRENSYFEASCEHAFVLYCFESVK